MAEFVKQNLPRINDELNSGKILENVEFEKLIDKSKASNGLCHVMGLLSPGGVHSHQDHLISLVNLIKKQGVEPIVHLFLDGRDTPPKSAVQYYNEFVEGTDFDVRVGSISGRYYSMDRDNRWDRVQKSYDAIVSAEGEKYGDVLSAINDNYQKGFSDEFIVPSVIDGYQGVEDGDSLLFVNFRSDRVRELLSSLIEDDFNEFDRRKIVSFCHATGMVKYSDKLEGFHGIMFPPQEMKQVLGEVVSNLGLNQLRIAETEKYAHVTFFL